MAVCWQFGWTYFEAYLMQPASRGMCASTSAVYWMSMSDRATIMLLRTTGNGERPSSCSHRSHKEHKASLIKCTVFAVQPTFCSEDGRVPRLHGCCAVAELWIGRLVSPRKLYFHHATVLLVNYSGSKAHCPCSFLCTAMPSTSNPTPPHTKTPSPEQTAAPPSWPAPHPRGTPCPVISTHAPAHRLAQAGPRQPRC